MADFTIGQEVHVEIIKSDTGMYEVRTVHFMDDMKKMTDMGEVSEKGDSQ